MAISRTQRNKSKPIPNHFLFVFLKGLLVHKKLKNILQIERQNFVRSFKIELFLSQG